MKKVYEMYVKILFTCLISLIYLKKYVKIRITFAVLFSVRVAFNFVISIKPKFNGEL